MLDNKDYQQSHQMFLTGLIPVLIHKILSMLATQVELRDRSVLVCVDVVHNYALQD
jgi:hypothetical protein